MASAGDGAGDGDDEAAQAPPVGDEARARALTELELDDRYPLRPRNRGASPPFHQLFLTLFNPLKDVNRRPAGHVAARRQQGPHGPSRPSPHEQKRAIVARFFSRWRNEVGADVFPALRLILPEKDRERGMYGLKEKAIAKLLVRVMKIDRNSEDASNLTNWKLPGQSATAMVGDFAGRCCEVVAKRPLRTAVGSLTVDEVNEMLDRLSLAQKEEGQLPLMETFYKRMNAEEMMWLVRIVLRQMKIGATEKTLLDVWHPDAEPLFNISSDLRRVCWELHDPSVRLEGDDANVGLMQCFQPQLAQFQMHNFARMVTKLRPTDEDAEFWIEEKLDGERMQMHMARDDSHPGGFRFGFWSRKAKDYTGLYGNGLEDDNSALTRHLKGAFHKGVDSIILDGEMITWSMVDDHIVGFGTLKSAAILEQKNPFAMADRPVYRVFDILLLNDRSLTSYTLRERRKALAASVRDVHRRLEIHPYTTATKPEEIDPRLRDVVEKSSEGLVLKNPRSSYRLNQRNDDWIKVKPEYMAGYGEDFDCIVIGGYYGSGHRGGNLSSFLCGLRVDKGHVAKGSSPMKCYSFFKVGGGFAASDYANIRHQTDGRWKKWDPRNPPTEFVELGGGDRQFERPDVWIRPDESVVVAVKAASIHATDQFRMNLTLRFPRFKMLRPDKDWKSALSTSEFVEIKNNLEADQKDKQFALDEERKKRRGTARRKKELTVLGSATKDEQAKLVDAMRLEGAGTDVFTGLDVYIMTNSVSPEKKSKDELQLWAKHHGANIVQSAEPPGIATVICVADRNLVPVAALVKKGKKTIVRPRWLLDCVRQAEADAALGRQPILLPCEPRHIYRGRTTGADLQDESDTVAAAADHLGDSFATDVFDVAQLRQLLAAAPRPDGHAAAGRDKSDTGDRGDAGEPGDTAGRGHSSASAAELRRRGHTLGDPAGWLFAGAAVHCDDAPGAAADKLQALLAANEARFGGATLVRDAGDPRVTHVVVRAGDAARLARLRAEAASRGDDKLPEFVTLGWIRESWARRIRLDEDAFRPV